jgi:hypothetical protein
VICLSFDTDHVSDERMWEFVETVPIPGAATVFCTRRFEALEDARHELCPHPFLHANGDWDRELATTRALFPNAVGWRSHSCVYSHLLAERIANDGYLYASTHEDLGRAGLAPYPETWGIWQMPIYYMDNLDMFRSRYWSSPDRSPFAPELLDVPFLDEGVYVFDFHPVHLLLNTPYPEWYFERRDAFVAGAALSTLQHEGPGTRDFYDAVCGRMAAEGVESVTMASALQPYRDERPIVVGPA